jgi:hypothetical protein
MATTQRIHKQTYQEEKDTWVDCVSDRRLKPEQEILQPLQ